MTSGQSYAFKPALLRGEWTYRLAGSTLTLHDGSEIDLGRVTGAGFVNHRLSRNRIMRLDLRVGEARHAIGYNIAERAWRTDPHARAFLALVRDVLVALSGLRPGLAVTLGETGRWRLAMFLAGAVSALFGFALFVAALATGISSDRIAAGAIPMLLLVALGGVIMRAYRPWRAPPTGTAGAVAKVVDEAIDRLGAA